MNMFYNEMHDITTFLQFFHALSHFQIPFLPFFLYFILKIQYGPRKKTRKSPHIVFALNSLLFQIFLTIFEYQ